MAKYSITHTCGHKSVQELYGKMTSREYRITRMEEDVCTDCWREQQHERAQQQAAEVRGADRLPELDGTPRQVAWAADIRIAKLAELDKIMAEVDAHGTAEQQEQVRMARQLVAQQTRASYWIDNRTRSAMSLCGDILRKLAPARP